MSGRPTTLTKQGAAEERPYRLSRIFLADDRFNIRSALRLYLEHGLQLSVVGETSLVQELPQQLQLTRPDLLLVAWEILSLPETEFLTHLRSQCPDLKIIVLSIQPGCRQAALNAGADAFISNCDSPSAVREAILAVNGPELREQTA